MSEQHDRTAQVSNSVQRPDLDQLRAAGRRRASRRRAGLAGSVSVMLVAAILGGGWALSDRRGPTSELPAVTASPDSAHPTRSPAETVDEQLRRVEEEDEQRAARLIDTASLDDVQVGVDPHDAQRRATLARCAVDCADLPMALALSDDGFTTRTVVPVWLAGPDDGAQLVVRGEGVFEVRTDAGSSSFYSAAGEPLEVGDPEGSAWPVALGEVVTGVRGSGVAPWLGLIAFDPRTAASHAVPLPEGVRGFASWSQLVSSRITLHVGEAGNSRFYFSDNGGADWTESPEDPAGAMVSAVGSSELWLLELGDSGTLRRVRGSSDGVAWGPWQTVPDAPVLFDAAASRGEGLLVGRGEMASGAGPEPALVLFRDGAWRPWGVPVPGGLASTLQMFDWGSVVVRSRDDKLWITESGTTWSSISFR